MVGVILKNRKAGKMFLIHRFTIIKNCVTLATHST